MMAKLIIALLVFCLVGFGRGVVLPQLDPYWDNIDNYCGSRLANELEVICRGKYNELPGEFLHLHFLNTSSSYNFPTMVKSFTLVMKTRSLNR